METKKANLQRRSFLLTLGAGGAGVAAVAVGAKHAVPSAAPPAGQSAAEAGQGYAESAHVRNYYRTTRI